MQFEIRYQEQDFPKRQLYVHADVWAHDDMDISISTEGGTEITWEMLSENDKSLILDSVQTEAMERAIAQAEAMEDR